MRRVIRMKTYNGFRQVQINPDISNEEWAKFRAKLMLESKSIAEFLTEKVREYINGK